MPSTRPQGHRPPTPPGTPAYLAGVQDVPYEVNQFYLYRNSIHEKHQSGIRPHHSTDIGVVIV